MSHVKQPSLSLTPAERIAQLTAQNARLIESLKAAEQELVEAQAHTKTLDGIIVRVDSVNWGLLRAVHVARQSRARLVTAFRILKADDRVWQKHSFVEILEEREVAEKERDEWKARYEDMTLARDAMEAERNAFLPAARAAWRDAKTLLVGRANNLEEQDEPSQHYRNVVAEMDAALVGTDQPTNAAQGAGR